MKKIELGEKIKVGWNYYLKEHDAALIQLHKTLAMGLRFTSLFKSQITLPKVKFCTLH
jgi:hypothetical protein